MRFLKIALSLVVLAVALFAGVFVLAAVLVLGAIYFLIQRLRGRPAFVRVGVPPRAAPRPSARTRSDHAEIIDITATDVTPPAQTRPTLER